MPKVLIAPFLRHKLNADPEKLQYKDSAEDQAINDYCKTIGLLRAIVTLKDVEKKEEKDRGRDDLAQRIRRHTKEQAKYWLDLLKQLQ